MKPLLLYIHIPFCRSKCPYCDFNSYAVDTVPEEEYTDALLAELAYRVSHLEDDYYLHSMYFGGGTPSLFRPAAIRKIIYRASTCLKVQDGAEITLEVNPGTVDPFMLREFRHAGVNRLSIGTQSMDDALLTKLGRIHDAEQNAAIVQGARQARFENISLDLMYAAPGQTLPQVQADLDHMLSFDPQHLSAYTLTVEKGTGFFKKLRRGRLKLPAEKAVVEMMECTAAALSRHGYQHYEISNFCKPDRHARHNMGYWNGLAYLGLGAGAHSYLAVEQDGLQTGGRRWSNYQRPAKYMRRACDRGCADARCEVLGLADCVFEKLFLGLRKLDGINLLHFEERFGLRLQEIYPTMLAVLLHENLIAVTDDHLKLTKRGFFLADSVIANFAEPDRDPLKLKKRALEKLPAAA